MSLSYFLQFRESYALAAVHQALYAAMNPSVLEPKRDEYSPEVFDAVREKFYFALS